jgi:hypothetical protein
MWDHSTRHGPGEEITWCRLNRSNPYRRFADAPERPDDCVPSPLTACSPHRRPSLPPSLTPHGPSRLDPDRAAPVCCADSVLVNTSPSPAPLPRYPSAPWPTAHARDPDLIHHRRRGEARAGDGRDTPARKAWCLWCTTSCLACTTHRGQGATPPTASRQGCSRTRGPAPTTPAVRSLRVLPGDVSADRLYGFERFIVQKVGETFCPSIQTSTSGAAFATAR